VARTRSRRHFQRAHDFIIELFASQGIRFEAEFICPHFPADGCACRKPGTGLVTRFIAHNPPDLDRSFVIGDRDTDLQFAENLGWSASRSATARTAP
jgi:imidazoleglycerol-phosphate dehydratase / histidinol-phosphatase